MSLTSNANPSNPPGVSAQSWLAMLALSLAVAAAYSNSSQGEFIFDDLKSIPGNPSIRSLWPIGDVLLPDSKEHRTTLSRPVLNLSLAINYAWGGLEVTGYHLFNLLIHIAATLTLYGIVRRTLLLPGWRSEVLEHSLLLAFVCALLWGLHPLQTESVTYVIQRAESMAGLFFLLTLYASIRGYDSRVPAAWYGLSVAACTFGVATKEVVATAPLVVLLYDRTFLFSTLRDMLRSRRGLYAALLGTWLILLALMVQGQGRGSTVGFHLGVTPLEYLATQCWAIPHYLRLALVPYPLVADYGSELVKTPAEVLPGLVVLVALLVGTIAAFRFHPWIGFLGTSFFLILAPSSSFVPIVSQTIAEHRMYLPLAAVIVFLVIVAFRLWRQLQERRVLQGRRPLGRGWPALAILLCAGALAVTTYRRNFDYRTTESIFRDTTAKRPQNSRSHLVMAELLFFAGQPEAALRELELGMPTKSRSANDYYNLGTLLLMYKRPTEAIQQFDAAIKLNSSDAATWSNRGIAWQELGQHDLAIRDFSAALDRDRNLAWPIRAARSLFRRSVSRRRRKPTGKGSSSWAASPCPDAHNPPRHAGTSLDRAARAGNNRETRFVLNADWHARSLPLACASPHS